jgi:hypothetical protein
MDGHIEVVLDLVSALLYAFQALIRHWSLPSKLTHERTQAEDTGLNTVVLREKLRGSGTSITIGTPTIAPARSRDRRRPTWAVVLPGELEAVSGSAQLTGLVMGRLVIEAQISGASVSIHYDINGHVSCPGSLLSTINNTLICAGDVDNELVWAAVVALRRPNLIPGQPYG